MELSHDDIIAILNTVQESGYSYFNLEMGDLKVTLGSALKTSQGASISDYKPATEDVAATSAVQVGEIFSSSSNYGLGESVSGHIITAPIVGIYYRSPAPGEPPYVAVGDKVSKGDAVGLIEVMKVYNSVASDVTGTVVELLAEDNDVVEYGQPLLVIEPDTI
jgi:acetyl-CoA carboxylase biotin carboxyl carrier protein